MHKDWIRWISRFKSMKGNITVRLSGSLAPLEQRPSTDRINSTSTERERSRYPSMVGEQLAIRQSCTPWRVFPLRVER